MVAKKEKPTPDYSGLDKFIGIFVGSKGTERVKAVNEASKTYHISKTEIKEILRDKEEDKKENTVEEEAIPEPTKDIPLKEIETVLHDTIGKNEIEKEKILTKLADDSGEKITTLRKELTRITKERSDRDKRVKKDAGKELSEGEFHILKQHYATVPALAEYIDGGIETINLNDNVRANCRFYLKEYYRTRKVAGNVKELVQSHLLRQEFGDATEILVKQILDRRYIYSTKSDKSSEMWIYSEGIYLPNGESNVKEDLRNIMKENYSEWLANQVLAKIRTDTYIDAESFFRDHDQYEIPVQNGLLNLKELELKDFDPTKIYFSKMPVTYQVGMACPKIDKFLSEVLSHTTDKDVFYEMAGFGLIKDYFLEKAVMFVGNGRNGKGKCIELLKLLVGGNNCASVPLSALTPDSPFIYKLFSRLFNLAGDISSGDLKDTAMFKQLTGRDLISANRKYKEVIEFKNYAKFIFACNELPRVYDYSDGFWERWLLIEFPYKFVDKDVYDAAYNKDKEFWKIKDPQIIDKITDIDEMSGLLNMAILGLHRILKNKKFSYTTGTDEVKNKWIRMSDSFMAFCMDNIEEDYDSRISKKDMRSIYKKYCSNHRVGGMGDKAIKATLQEMFGCTDEFITPVGASKQEWCWSGVKFKVKTTEKQEEIF